MQAIVEKGLDLIYPRLCGGCGRRVRASGLHTCLECWADLQVIGSPLCTRCGDPPDGKVDHDYICAWCERTRPAFDRARSAARYRGVLRTLLQAFKYQDAVWLRSDLVRLLDATVETWMADIPFDGVLPVPLYARRERARTYNQSALLAQGLARSRRLECLSHFLVRERDTPTQTHLTASQRQRNVRGAFAVRHADWIDGKTLLLVDDVMTTGATVAEISRVLKGAGAAGVYVVSVARG